MATAAPEEQTKKEIYTYETAYTIYAMAWCRRIGGSFRMAIGSYKEEYSNQVQIVQLNRDEGGSGTFKKLCEVDHPYPATKVLFAPEKHPHTTGDLLATSGDYLRLWNINADNDVEMKAILNNNKHTGMYQPFIIRIPIRCI